MKKGILLVLVMALVPASAFGVAINLSTSSAIPDNTGGTISVDVNLDVTGHTGTGINGYTYRVHSDSTGIQLTARDTSMATLTNLTTSDVGLGMPLTLNPWSGTQDLGASYAGAELVTASEKIATLTFTIPAGLGVGTTVVLTPGVSGPPMNPVQPPSYAVPLPAVGGTATAGALSIVITPEPGSVMLLLAAIPFLLRRRA